MMTLTVQIIAILFMLTMIFIAIWGFIIANQAYSQIKYQNYLLEKIAQNISFIGNKPKNSDSIQENESKAHDEISSLKANENTVDDNENIIDSE